MAKYHVTFTDNEREELAAIIHPGCSKSAQVRRNYLLLAADQNGDKHQMDERSSSVDGVSIASVERLRCRFVEEGSR